MKTQTNVRGDEMNIRRRRKQQQIKLTLLVSAVLLTLFVLLFIQLSSNTIIGSKDITVDYLSVEVYADDTLWDLAEEFIDTNYYNTEAYIEEIITINGLKTETIYPGQRLLMPVVEENFLTASN